MDQNNQGSILSAMKVFVGVALYALVGLAAAAGFDGPYFGVSVGGTSGKANMEHSLQGANCNQILTCTLQQDAVNALPSGMNMNDFTAGAQAGYNWSSGKAVFGFEFDVNYLTQKNSQTSVVVYTNANNNQTKTLTSIDSVDSSWVATIRPRIGFMVMDKALVYLTGGFAFGNPNVSNLTTVFNTSNGGFTTTYNLPSSKEFQAGWVVGTGFEYGLSNRMSVKGEYQYIHFGNPPVRGGSLSSQGDLAGSTFVVDSNVKTSILRVGLNWRF